MQTGIDDRRVIKVLFYSDLSPMNESPLACSIVIAIKIFYMAVEYWCLDLAQPIVGYRTTFAHSSFMQGPRSDIQTKVPGVAPILPLNTSLPVPRVVWS